MSFPIPPVNPEGLQNTAWIENFLSQDDLNLISAYKNPKAQYNNQEGTINSWDGAVLLNSDVRSTKITWLYQEPKTLAIYDKVSMAILELNARYFKFDINGIWEPMQIGVYRAEDKAHYDWHTDGALDRNSIPRKLSFSLLLNDPDEFEGGELQTKTTSGQTVLEQKQNRAWIFPSYLLHKVTPVTKGVRKSLVVWAGGPQFK